jgi:hypothetical protein
LFSVGAAYVVFGGSICPIIFRRVSLTDIVAQGWLDVKLSGAVKLVFSSAVAAVALVVTAPVALVVTAACSSVSDASLLFDWFLDILKIIFTSPEVTPDADTSFKLVL